MIQSVITIGEMAECFLRMIANGFAFPDSKLYLLSRDGEQLRPVGDLLIHHNDCDWRLDICRGKDGDDTIVLRQLTEIIGTIKRPGGRVRILADGHGEANLVNLQSVLMAPDLDGRDLDLSEIDVVRAG
jgi:hypothetical protein